jgi:hypothetical protein
MKKSLLFCLFFICATIFSQKKSLKAFPIQGGISIDGNLDESNWKTASVANDFYMFAPDNGKQISPKKETQVKILYDNEAIYIGATLYDDEPNKILKEIQAYCNHTTKIK